MTEEKTEGRDLSEVKEDQGQERRTCCQKVKAALSFLPKGATPPDWPFLWLVFISLFSSAFTLTFLFPFLPEMILRMGYLEEEKGTYTGLVASSVFGGRALGSFFWGWLSDIKGRRLVLLITIALNGLFSFLFGFVHNLPFAMALRFLAGLCNGTVGVAKTVLYDVSDNTNQAFHMSVISVAWGSGLILGPTIGGYLALPASKYPSVFTPGGFFSQFPFVLPSFCCLIVCGACFVIVFFKFKDPKPVMNKGNAELVITVEDKEENTTDLEASDSGLALPSSSSNHTKVESTHQPLLSTQPAGSKHSLSSKKKLGMSIESLHCEADISYFYAQLESEKREENLRRSHEEINTRGVTPLGGKGDKWHSLHNLSPPSGVDETTTRRRCYSHSEQTLHDKIVKRKLDGNPIPENESGVNKEGGARTKSGVGSRQVKGESEQVNEHSHVKNGINNGSGDLQKVNGDINASESSTLLTTSQNVKFSNSQCGKSSGDCVKKNGDQAVSVEVEDGEVSVTSGEDGRKGCCKSCWSSLRTSALATLLRMRDVQHSVCLYTVLSFAVIGYEDIFTVFASTSPDYDGLGFSTDEIGTALGVVSVPLMFIQIKIYPFLVARFGIKRSYLINVFCLLVAVQLLPMLHLLVNQKVWLWVCLVSISMPMRISANSCFAGSSLLINNSVTPAWAGKANGVGMTATAIARTLAPTLGGAMYSWSLRMSRTVGPPLDVNIVFVFFGFILFLSAIQCLLMPDHLDHQKK